MQTPIRLRRRATTKNSWQPAHRSALPHHLESTKAKVEDALHLRHRATADGRDLIPLGATPGTMAIPNGAGIRLHHNFKVQFNFAALQAHSTIIPSMLKAVARLILVAVSSISISAVIAHLAPYIMNLDV